MVWSCKTQGGEQHIVKELQEVVINYISGRFHHPSSGLLLTTVNVNLQCKFTLNVVSNKPDDGQWNPSEIQLITTSSNSFSHKTYFSLNKYFLYSRRAMELEVEGKRPVGRPTRTQSKVLEEDMRKIWQRIDISGGDSSHPTPGVGKQER